MGNVSIIIAIVIESYVKMDAIWFGNTNILTAITEESEIVNTTQTRAFLLA